MQKINANGLSFMIGMEGRGEPLLFLPGTGADLRRPRTALTCKLVDHFTVLTFDQRGLGQSDKPTGPYSMQAYADDAAAILAAVEWETAHVVGYSFGGMVAQELAIRWPEKISSLCLVGSTAGGAGGSSYPIHELSKFAPHEQARKRIEVADTSFTAEWQAENVIAAEQRINDRMNAKFMFIDEPGARAGQALQMATRNQHDTYRRLKQIKCRTLVLAGSRDGQAPKAAQKAMAEQLSNCIYEELEGSHMMVWESDNTFNRIIDFIDMPQEAGNKKGAPTGTP